LSRDFGGFLRKEGRGRGFFLEKDKKTETFASVALYKF
jgi:hypothetical protein